MGANGNGVASGNELINYPLLFLYFSYVLDTTTNAAGELEPILRPASRSQSEENIVLDIGREAISVQNLQER